MSHEGKPTTMFIKKVSMPTDSGKEICKNDIVVELFPAKSFRYNWNPRLRNFDPAPPLRDADREDWWKWWEKLYRVRLNGKWYGEKQFTFMTEIEAAGLLLR